MAFFDLSGIIRRFITPGIMLPTERAIRRRILSAIIRASRREPPTVPSGQDILTGLRKEEVGVRRKEFYKIHRAVVAQSDAIQRQLDADPTVPIRRRDVPVAEYASRMPYTYEFDLYIYDYQVKEWGWQHLRMSDVGLMSPVEAASMYQERFGWKFEDPHVDWESMSFAGLFRQGDLL